MNFKSSHMILVSLLGFILIMCNDKTEISKASKAEEERVRQIGEKTTGFLLKSLQKELKTTIANDGIVAALSVCNLRAMQLTDSVKQSIDEVIDIKRTSLKNRNPANAPDPIEREALLSFQKNILKSGSLPEDIIVKVVDTSGEHYRYYKPLLIKPLCLNCHGQSGNITPEVSNHLNKLYPSDQAKGYSIDQFRGLVSISVR